MALTYLRNVVSLALSEETCIGCGKCGEVCPHGAFDCSGAKARIIQKDSCMECGACALNCPVDAISVKSGVGCAVAYMNAWSTGDEPSCDCSDGDCC